MTATSNPEVLASCADTVNLHLSIFDAIGVTRELFELLLGRLRDGGLGAGDRGAAASRCACQSWTRNSWLGETRVPTP